MTFSTVNKVIFCDNFHRKNICWRKLWISNTLSVRFVNNCTCGLCKPEISRANTGLRLHVLKKSDRVWNWMWTTRSAAIYSSIMISHSLPLFFPRVIFMKFLETLWNFLRFLSNFNKFFSAFFCETSRNIHFIPKLTIYYVSALTRRPSLTSKMHYII